VQILSRKGKETDMCEADD